MRHILLITILFTLSKVSISQKKQPLSIEANYGLNGNFFVRRYDETSGPSAKRFYNKNFVGTVGGIELKYKIGKASNLGLAYSRSHNSREINFIGNVLPVGIIDFHISHISNSYMLYYERQFTTKNEGFCFHAGLIYQRTNQQEVEIGDFVNGGAGFEERNFKNSRLEEGGCVFGLHYSKFIDAKFELGIKGRGYYLISTGTFDMITLTPTLTYHFIKK